MLCNLVGDVAIDAGFTDGVHTKKISKETEEWYPQNLQQARNCEGFSRHGTIVCFRRSCFGITFGVSAGQLGGVLWGLTTFASTEGNKISLGMSLHISGLVALF